MRKLILGAAAVLLIGAGSTGILIAHAQPAPPSASDQMGGPMQHSNWMGWRHRMGGPKGLRAFALIYRQADRQLSPPDVQKIAEAFLLWNGNHSWKVVDVKPTPDGAIGFSLATQEGSVIASFTMDPHSARVTRTG